MSDVLTNEAKKRFKNIHHPDVTDLDFKITALLLELNYWKNEVNKRQCEYYDAVSTLNETRQELVNLKKQEAPQHVQVAQELLTIFSKNLLPQELFAIASFKVFDYVAYEFQVTLEVATKAWHLFLKLKRDSN